MSTKNPDSNPLIEIYSGTLWEADMVHSLLSDAGIQSFVKNHLGNSYIYNPVEASGVKVMILESDAREASEIVKNYIRTNRP